MKLAAVVLAAGASSRFGSPKQLLKMGGQNLVQRACLLATEAGCSPVVVVLGAHEEAICLEGLPSGVSLIRNPDWSQGMGTSLAMGVSAVSKFEVDGVLILLADQPGISSKTLEEMKKAFASSEVTIVRCEYEKVFSPPALFAAKHLPELAQLKGEGGGSEVARKHRDSVATISTPEVVWDIDSPDIWEKFRLQGKRQTELE